MSPSTFHYSKQDNITSFSELIKKSECYNAVVLGCNKYIATYTNYQSNPSDKQSAKHKNPACSATNNKTPPNSIIKTYAIQSTYNNANAHLQPLQTFNIQDVVLSMEFDNKGMLYVVTEDQSMQNLQCLLLGMSGSKSNIAIHNVPKPTAPLNKPQNIQLYTPPTRISATNPNTQTKIPQSQTVTNTNQKHKICSGMLQSMISQTSPHNQDCTTESKQYTNTDSTASITAVLTSDLISVITSLPSTHNKTQEQYQAIFNKSDNNSNTTLNSQNKQSIQWYCPDLKNAACVITPKVTTCYCTLSNFSYAFPYTTISIVKINTNNTNENRTPRIDQQSSILLPSCNMGSVLFFSPLQTTNPQKDFNIVVQCQDKLIAIPDYRNTYQQITLKSDCINLFHKIIQGCTSKISPNIKQYIIPSCIVDTDIPPSMLTTENLHKSTSKSPTSDIAALDTTTSQIHTSIPTATHKPFTKERPTNTSLTPHNDVKITTKNFKHTVNPLSLSTNKPQNHQLTQYTQVAARRTDLNMSKQTIRKSTIRMEPTALTQAPHAINANKTNVDQTSITPNEKYFIIATVIASVIFASLSTLIATFGIRVCTKRAAANRRYRLKDIKRINHKERADSDNRVSDELDSDDSSQTLMPKEQSAANQNRPDTTTIQISDSGEIQSLLQPTCINIA